MNTLGKARPRKATLLVCALILALTSFPLSSCVTSYDEEKGGLTEHAVVEATSLEKSVVVISNWGGSEFEELDSEELDPGGLNPGGLDPEEFDSEESDVEVSTTVRITTSQAEYKNLAPEPVYTAPSVSAGSSGSYSSMVNLRITGTARYDYAYQILDLLNQERANAGLGALTMNASLNDAAMQRAAEVAVYFDHTRPNGQSALTVSYLVGGENLGVGYSGPAEVMNMWMGSWGHRSNILNGSWSSVGIGVFYHEGIPYWVQLFSTSPSSTPGQPGNATRTYTVSVNLNTCVFPSATIVSDSSVAVGETKYYRLKLGNPRPEVSSWAFCYPEMDSGITCFSSDSSLLQVSAGTITGLAGGSVTLSVGLGGRVLATKTINVN